MSDPLKQRVPSLDGLRALSISAVLVGHLIGTDGFPLQSSLPWPSLLSRYGVTVFFVISGFLITSLLIDEQQMTGRISLRDFYIRRALRIAPAFLLFLGCMMLAHAAGWVALTAGDIASALTWTVNFNPHRSWTIGHLWSLSAEEQFYLLWPATVVMLGLYRSRTVALAAVVAGPLVRVAMRLTIHDPAMRDLEIFPAVADSIAIGCLLALYRTELTGSRAWTTLTSQKMFIPLLVMVAAAARWDGYTAIHLVGVPLTLVATAAILHGCIRASGSALGGFLNSQPLMWLGRLSYSLYLWQQPFMNRAAHSAFNAFPLNLAAALLCAVASYYLVEQPLLRLRRRFRHTAPASVGDTPSGSSLPVRPADSIP